MSGGLPRSVNEYCEKLDGAVEELGKASNRGPLWNKINERKDYLYARYREELERLKAARRKERVFVVLVLAAVAVVVYVARGG